MKKAHPAALSGLSLHSDVALPRLHFVKNPPPCGWTFLIGRRVGWSLGGWGVVVRGFWEILSV